MTSQYFDYIRSGMRIGIHDYKRVAFFH